MASGTVPRARRYSALFGLADSGGGAVEMHNAKGNYVTFVFKGDALDRIIWELGRE